MNEANQKCKMEPKILIFNRETPSKKSLKVVCPAWLELKISSNLSCDFQLGTLNSKNVTGEEGTQLSEYELNVTYTPSSSDPTENRMRIKLHNFPSVNHSFLLNEDIMVKFEGDENDIQDDCFELLTCSICLQEFNESIENLLPTSLFCCGRQLCFGCFEPLRNMSYCPFERLHVGLGAVAHKNEGILKVMRSRKQTKKSKPKSQFVEDPDIPCFENAHHESSLYCSSCDAHFCEGCFKVVHEPKIFSTHRSILLKSKPVIVPKCQKHPTMLTEFVCQEPNCRNDSKLMCQNCLLTVHRSHGYDILTEQIEQNQHKLQAMREKISTFEGNIQTRLDNVKDAGASFNNDSDCMKSAVAKIENHFDEMKQKELRYLEEFSKVRRSQLKKKQDTLERDLHLTKSTKREIERMLILKNKLHSIDEIMGQSEAVCAHNSKNADSTIYLRLDQHKCDVEGDMKLRISDK